MLEKILSLLPDWFLRWEYAPHVLIALFAAGIIGFAVLGQYTCHRYIGPWMTGGDATAAALYCRPSR